MDGVEDSRASEVAGVADEPVWAGLVDADDGSVVVEESAEPGGCAAPELANQVFAYREGVVLLAWYDAPFEPILLPGGTPEDHIHDLAARLGARYERETA